jgi:L-arabinokinase
VSIVFFISGHGFGHASRTIEVINAFGHLEPSVTLHIRTSVSPWLFERTLRVPAALHAGETDTGMVQIDSLRLDVRASLTRAREFYSTIEQRTQAEAKFLRGLGARLVVADLPPLGLLAASRAQVPAVAMGNFTWDWIYEAYPEQPDLAPGVPSLIRSAHALADVALRFPMHGGFAGFRTIEDVPLVARHATRGPAEVRATLGLPVDRRLVLVSFGGYGLDWQSPTPLGSRRHHLVLTASTPEGVALTRAKLGPNTTVIAEHDMHRTGIRYEDLLRACDVVASKPGYGIVAECIANQRPLLYTDRGAFIESHALLAAMPRWLRARYVTHERVFGGEWDDEVDAVLALPPPPEEPSTHGAEVVASRLAGRLACR